MQENTLPSSGRKRSEVRAIRIPSELGSILEKEADTQRISVNALITLILKKYAEFDRLSDKFEFVSVPQKTFSLIIRELDDDKIEKAARAAGATIPEEVIRFWFDESSLRTFMSFVSIFSRYYRLAKCEIQVNYSDYTIMLHHNMGLKWSKYLRHFFDAAIRDILETVPKFEVSEDLVVMKFTARGPIAENQ